MKQSRFERFDMLRVSRSKLKNAPYNPRRIGNDERERLRAGLEDLGLCAPLVWNQQTGNLVGGHQRLAILDQLEGGKAYSLNVARVKMDPKREKKLNLLLNNSKAQGAWDDEKLMAVLNDIGDLTSTGFDQSDLDQIIAQCGGKSDVDAEPQIDKAEELRKKWKVKTGQIWQLGDHRLMCGDSTSADVQKVANSADLCLTDPPYSVAYTISFSKAEGKKNAGAQRAYSESKDPSKLLMGFLKSMPCNFLVMTYPVDRHLFMLAESLNSNGFCHIRELVWVKSSASFHPGQTYQQQHEPILICRKTGIKFSKYTPNTATTVLSVDRPSSHTDHPTEKPIQLWDSLLKWHSAPGATVYEPFSGSGSTIIACERNSRKCVALEITPTFVAVAIQRWADATGKTPKLLT